MRRKSPTNDAVFHVAAGRDRAGLEVKHISSFKGEQSRSVSWTGPPRGRSVSARSVVLNLGRGVFAVTGLARGEFVLEYRGDLISAEESRRRRRVYHGAMNAFMFDFLWHGKFWTIDAARDDGSLGRLVNDDHINPNCKMKRLIVEGRPHLCLFALRDITPGEEITYNYGDGDCPWRSEVIKSGMEADNNHLESEGASGDDQHCIKPSQHKPAFGVQMKKNAGSNRLESEVASGDDQHRTQHSQLESTFCSEMTKNGMEKDSNRLESEVASRDDQHCTQHSQLEFTFLNQMTKNGMEKDSNRLESEVASRDDQHCTQHSQLESTFPNQMTKNGMEKDSNRLESEVASRDDQHCTQHSQLESTFPNQVTTIVMQEHSHHLESDLTCGDAQQQRSAFLVQILEQNRTYTASSGDLG